MKKLSEYKVDTSSTNYIQVIPNSHFWTSIEMLLEWLKQSRGGTKEEMEEYLRIGLENSLKNGYNIQKIEEI